MENLRRVVQVLAFSAFLYLFLLTIGRYDAAAQRIVLPSAAPIDTFFRIDPLLGLGAMLSTRQVIHVMLVYALPVVVLAILAGRFFCGWICPMGVALDATDTLFFRGRKRRPTSRASRNIKYYLLAGIVAAALFGAQIAYFLDPITIITRAFTFAIFPLAQLGVGSLSGSDFVRERLPFLMTLPYFPRDVEYFFRLNFLAAVTFIGILTANAISRRYWCRNLCPLGALLGVLSRFSIVRRVVKSGCNKCTRCIPDCKMGAINDDPTHYQATECIYCYSCTAICPALSTTIAPAPRSEGYHSELDLTRRRTIQAFGAGALIALLGKTNAAAKTSRTGKTRVSSAALIRPPGSLPEDEFADRCLRCSECMKVCPTGGLQPSLTEAGIRGLWSPVLVPNIGECTQNCNLCSEVCSSQAVQPFEISEKSHIFIGTAVIDRSQCIAWNSDRQCLVCDEHCSYHALYWEDVDGVRRPFIDEHKCVGCGICENACPIQPLAAIRVFSFGDRRHLTREQQKAFFDQAPKRPDLRPPVSADPYRQ